MNFLRSEDVDTLFNTFQKKEVQLQVRSDEYKDKIKSLGCWKDEGKPRAIEGGIRFRSKSNPIGDCYEFAKKHRFTVFAVQYHTECFTAWSAADTYKKYGETDTCKVVRRVKETTGQAACTRF